MVKKVVRKSNGNVFKAVVRGVVREELGKFEERVEKRFDKNEFWLEKLDQKIDTTFRKYRDDVLTKMDEVVGELKTTREEQSAELMLHEELEERVENLESIHPKGKHAN